MYMKVIVNELTTVGHLISLSGQDGPWLEKSI